MQVTDTSIASGRMLTCWQCRHPWISVLRSYWFWYSVVGQLLTLVDLQMEGDLISRQNVLFICWVELRVPSLFLTDVFVVVFPPSCLYVIECFNVSFTTCRLCSKSKFFHAFRFVLLTALVHFVIFNTLLFLCLVLLVYKLSLFKVLLSYFISVRPFAKY